MNTEDDWRYESHYALNMKKASRCKCGNPDWPGLCPGPANCPCCQSGGEDDAKED